ncbi:uncharacterized protein METZ01_LOCUS127054 [marine metagenome]|uniref:ABC transmembrane type-2 domain-containing protein n=1 Tax=marine metagenome TaxID=408172 RepID=A0A381YBC6_9ZZZZ|tara:strand:- start:76 stop:936 length:861 start_codon:yes stop_codon:yes gene_type:complete
MEHASAPAPDGGPNDRLVQPGRPLPLGIYLRELWRRRDFLIRVPLEDLRAQNAHTLLGGIWLVLNPLLQVGVYFLVFGVIMPIDRGVDQYLVFLTIGVFVFFYSQRVISEAARSVVVNLGLIRTLRFPRATLPLSATVGQTMAFVPSLAVMVAVVAAHGTWPHPRWLLIPALVTLQGMFSLGGGFIAARYNHTYRDLENLLPFVFRLAFYVSGVLYSVDHYIDSTLGRAVFLANPFYCFVTVWRWVLTSTPAAGEVWVATGVWSTATLVVGFALFRARENTYGGTG